MKKFKYTQIIDRFDIPGIGKYYIYGQRNKGEIEFFEVRIGTGRVIIESLTTYSAAINVLRKKIGCDIWKKREEKRIEMERFEDMGNDLVKYPGWLLKYAK